MKTSESSQANDPEPRPPAPGNSATGVEEKYYPSGTKSLAGIAIRSFCLGITFLASVALSALLALNTDPLWRLPFFWAALSLFHFLEFWTTAAYNTPAATIGSFLLTANWPAYFIAHTFGSVECLLRNLALRYWEVTVLPPTATRLVVLTGFVLVLVGQTVRSLAMVTAGKSFNHIVQHQKKETHRLVTTGVYGVLRHPSYFGFFWWAVGTQVVLGNPISFVAYAFVMHMFFKDRIRREEGILVRFFGRDYEEYRRRVGIKIPLIN
jgi:protein-S-isoprenylcysteine O-methyltransferase